MELQKLLKPSYQTFLDAENSFDESRYVVFGAKMDITGTYIRGARFGPDLIRRASRHIESHSLRSGIDAEDLPICDLGDLHEQESVEGWLDAVEAVTRTVRGASKIPVMIGGEHTLTLGALRGIGDAGIVDLDAHLDMRNELFGRRLSHATFLRRALEANPNRSFIVLGARALSKEEIGFADPKGYVAAPEFKKAGVANVVEQTMSRIPDTEVYLSIDMDVIDPAEAPAVCNPYPEGLSVSWILDFIHVLSSKRRIIGLDLCEAAPYYDSGATSIQAAKILMETLLAVEKSLDRDPKARGGQ